VYDSYLESGWEAFGGTSVSASIIAGVYAMASPPSPGDSPVSYPYSSPQLLFDVTQGSLASCTGSYLCEARTGYDAPTGLGTPNGVGAFGPSSQTFAVAVPPTATVRAGSTTTVTVSTKTTSGPPQ